VVIFINIPAGVDLPFVIINLALADCLVALTLWARLAGGNR
jgi:hypothetical protein